MAKVNTHGLTIKGLKETSGKTKDYGSYSGHYVEIFYDRKTGEVWGIEQFSLGHNTWTEYRNPSIIGVCNATMHMTMQMIADTIKQRIDSIQEAYAASMWD